MNIIYIHGLLSSNNSSKTEWLKQANHTVFNPLLNYKEDSKTIFSDLEKLCDQYRIDLIIGSSMGGWLAYNLSNKYNIPSLLFNPSLKMNNVAKPDVKVVENDRVLHTVVLGKNDNVVIPLHTINFLENRKSNFRYTFEQNGHRTPFEVFRKHLKLLLLKENTL